MMGEEKKTCPACGSALDAAQNVCDICGEDLTATPQPVREKEESTAVPETSTAKDAPAPAVKKSPGKRKVHGKTTQGKTAQGAALFSTTQWITLCVASFVLGGVITSTVLPTGAPQAPSQTAAQQNAPGQQQQPQVDFARLEEMRTYLENNPDDQASRLRYANDLHDAHLLDQAIAQYKIYLDAVPDNPDARVDLGICYFELKQYPAAIAEMERAVAKHPDHQLGNYNLGIVNLNAGNREAARAWFEKARDLDPTSPYGRNAAELLQTQFSQQN